ncbi:MarR family winged helix-turn-helix transcriptional regulator [Nonomuraea jiangxiensis]|uniref:MarR family winged helix-turn-helix transcriptional regulator n=1 Tax=Nonomuraea jiangxiensis TaxID=633440 RepID=UPI000B820AE1|nr:MarR family transcriptional regulator [Nonomuraea jiangxiensis]
MNNEPAKVRDLDNLGFDAWLALWKGEIVVARALDRDLKANGCQPLTACEVLSRLGAAPQGRLQMHELARRCFVSKSGISQLVTQLQRQGLVERGGDADNLRITYAVLTDRGRDELGRSAPIFLGGVGRYFSQYLDEDEMRSLVTIMNKVLLGHGQTVEAPDPRGAAENLYEIIEE